MASKGKDVEGMKPSLSSRSCSYISSGSNHMAVITDNGELLIWGYGEYGQLGLGDTSLALSPTLVRMGDKKSAKMRFVSCSEVHTLSASDDGQLYVWGLGSKGQLGLGAVEGLFQHRTPQHVSAFSGKRILSISAGHLHSACVTEDGLFVWGHGNCGQLGLQHDTNRQWQLGYDRIADEPIPQRVPASAFHDAAVTSVSCGDYFTACLTDVGKLYTWGRGDAGRLGLGNTSHQHIPQLVTGLEGMVVTHMACGYFHAAAIVEDGKLFIWGRNHEYQLGLGHCTNQLSPQLVTALQDKVVVDVSCGVHHTAIVTDDGQVYTCGSNMNGQLGSKHATHKVPQPVVGLNTHKVTAVSSGMFHTACLTAAGQVFTFGRGVSGQLGTGKTADQKTPQQVQGLHVQEVQC